MRTREDFFTRASVIMDYGLKVQKQQFKVKMSCFLQTQAFGFTSCELIDWSGVDYCDGFYQFFQLFGLSFWWHPFTAEHPLVSKSCNATFLQIWPDGGGYIFSKDLIFAWTISLRVLMLILRSQHFQYVALHFAEGSDISMTMACQFFSARRCLLVTTKDY